MVGHVIIRYTECTFVHTRLAPFFVQNTTVFFFFYKTHGLSRQRVLGLFIVKVLLFICCRFVRSRIEALLNLFHLYKKQ